MSASAVHNLAHQHASATAPELAHDGLPTRICFGAGASRAHLGTVLDGLGARRVGVVSSRTHTDTLRGIVACLNKRGIHTTILDAYAEEDLEGSLIAADGAALVAVGGNTITGRAKQAAAQLDVPLVVLPTTYSGAELDARLPRHTTAGFRSRGSLPAAVIYDPCLARTLSARQAGLSLLAATGNALQAITEASDGSLAQILAGQGLCQLSRAALDVLFDPESLRGPTAAQFGAYLTGAAAALSPRAAPMDAALADTDDGERFQLARAALVWRTAGNLVRRSDTHAPCVRTLEGVDIEVFVEQLIQAAGLTADLRRSTSAGVS